MAWTVAANCGAGVYDMDRNSMKVKIWGVRGAFPVANVDFLKYGGNTACISVDCGGRMVVFDAGSGLMQLGNQLYQSGKKRIDILLSHLHIDHCLGLLNFRPMFDPEAEIHLYGGRGDTAGLRQSLETLIGGPYWPLELRDFPARVEIHEITPGESFYLAEDGEAAGKMEAMEEEAAGATEKVLERSIPSERKTGRVKGSQKEENCKEHVRIRTMPGNHPNQSLLYRLEYGGKSIVHVLDCELNEEIFPTLSEFAREASLLIWDANFTDEELERHRGWGHSSWEQGIALRRRAEAETVLMTHYASSYKDRFLQEQERLAAMEDAASRFAREGMELEL